MAKSCSPHMLAPAPIGIKGHSTLLYPVDAGARMPRRTQPLAGGANRPCMVRRRRITTTCFLDVIRAPCGRRTFRTRHGRKVLLGGAREGTAAPSATGLRTAWKPTKSPAAPRSFRCRRDACGCGCRWHSGSASSKGTTAGSRLARAARAREESGGTERASVPDPSRSRLPISDPTFRRGLGVDGIIPSTLDGR